MKTEYSEHQYHSNYPDGVGKHWWNLVRNNHIHRILSRIGGDDLRALEVGCGRGIVVGYLRERGVNCVGVELADVKPMPGIAEYVRARTNALDLTAQERREYNTILLLDVIEHLPEPLPFIRNLLEAFPNLKHLVLTVPARQELWSNYDEYYGHYRRYSLEDLEDLSHPLGMEPMSKGYFFHGVYPLALLGAKRGRDREINIASPRGIGKWVHRLVSYALILDSKWVPGKVPGTSAFACYRIRPRG